MRERRQVPRYVSDLRGQLVQPDSLTGPDVKISTLSIKGSCIDGVGALKRGQKCELKVEWENKSLRAEAEVIWADARGRAGLRFLPMADERQALLKDLCASLKLQPIQSPQPPSSSPLPKTKYE